MKENVTHSDHVMIGKVIRRENNYIPDSLDYFIHIFQTCQIITITILDDHWESELENHLSRLFKKDITLLFSNEMESEVYCYILA